MVQLNKITLVFFSLLVSLLNKKPTITLPENQMRSLYPFLSPHTHTLSPWLPLPFSPIKNFEKSSIYPSGFGFNRKGTNSYHYHHPCAVERDSEFEFDPDKAREALRKLDLQLQSLSEKKISPPKIRATELDLTRELLEFDRATEQAAAGLPEGSFQVSAVIALLFFTIFYNVLFVTVIKPSIDGPDSAPAAVSVAPEAALLQQLPPSPGVSVQP